MPPSNAASPRRSALARLSRALLFTVAGLVALGVLILLGLAAVNSFDERERPQTRAALAMPDNPTADNRNLYYVMAGFEAPAGQSPLEFGKARIARYDHAVDSLQDVPHLTAAGTSDVGNELHVAGSGAPCAPLDASVWSDAKAQVGSIDAAAQINTELLARYTDLHAATGYYETARPSYLAPSVKIPRAVRCLYLAATAVALQSRDAHRQLEAARNFAADIAMWHTIGVGDGTLLSKRLAASELRADLRLAADAIADPDVSTTVLEAFNLQPFELKDWQLGTAYAAEFRSVAYIFRQLALTPAAKAYASGNAPPESPGWWQSLVAGYESRFFKYNATMNLSAARLDEIRKSTAADAAHYEAARAAFERWSNEHIKVASFRSLYNPTGRILLGLASINTDYQLRAYDDAAFQRLVFLSYQLRARHIARGDVRAFMVTHPEWSTHPVSGKFFAWDADTGRLSMIPMESPGEAAGLSVPIAR